MVSINYYLTLIVTLVFKPQFLKIISTLCYDTIRTAKNTYDFRRLLHNLVNYYNTFYLQYSLHPWIKTDGQKAVLRDCTG